MAGIAPNDGVILTKVRTQLFRLLTDAQSWALTFVRVTAVEVVGTASHSLQEHQS